jgi:nucleoid-associated protein YgaU
MKALNRWQLTHFLLFLSVLLVIFACASTQETTQETPAPAPVPASEPAPQPEPPPAQDPPPVQAPPPAAEPQPVPIPVVREIPPLPEKPASSIILTGARTHRVVWRDTLSKLAMRYYGRRNGYYYPLIILGNPGVITNPDYIVGGTRLVIPDLSRNLNNRAARAELKAYMTELADYYAQKRNRVMSSQLRTLARTL